MLLTRYSFCVVLIACLRHIRCVAPSFWKGTRLCQQRLSIILVTATLQLENAHAPQRKSALWYNRFMCHQIERQSTVLFFFLPIATKLTASSNYGAQQSWHSVRICDPRCVPPLLLPHRKSFARRTMHVYTRWSCEKCSAHTHARRHTAPCRNRPSKYPKKNFFSTRVQHFQHHSTKTKNKKKPFKPIQHNSAHDRPWMQAALAATVYTAIHQTRIPRPPHPAPPTHIRRIGNNVAHSSLRPSPPLQLLHTDCITT